MLDDDNDGSESFSADEDDEFNEFATEFCSSTGLVGVDDDDDDDWRTYNDELAEDDCSGDEWSVISMRFNCFDDDGWVKVNCFAEEAFVKEVDGWEDELAEDDFLLAK